MLDIDYLLVLDGTVLEWQVLLLFYNYYFGGQIIFDEQQTMLSLFDYHLINQRLKQVAVKINRELESTKRK